MKKKFLTIFTIALTGWLVSCAPIGDWFTTIFTGIQVSEPALLGTLQIAILAFMIVGLFSLIIPVMPGLTIVWLGVLIYALATGLDTTSGIIFGFQTLLMLGGNFADNLFMGAKARQSGASWLAVLAASLAAIIGSFLLPPFGGLLAAVIVLFTIETLRLKDWRKALDSTKEMAKGCGCAFFARFAIGLTIIGSWIVMLLLTDQWLL